MKLRTNKYVFALLGVGTEFFKLRDERIKPTYEEVYGRFASLNRREYRW